MTDLPAPLVAADCDLSQCDWVPFHFNRLRDSAFWLKATDQARSITIDLWCEACRQVPAGSLPDDDALLAIWAGFGRYAIDRWREIKADVMAPWTLCSDGRYYNPTLCDVVEETYARIQKWDDAREAEADRKAASRGGRKKPYRPRDKNYRVWPPAHGQENGVEGAAQTEIDPIADCGDELPGEPSVSVSSADASAAPDCPENVRRTNSGQTPLNNRQETYNPPTPPGGDSEVSFEAFEVVWPPQDPSDADDAAFREWAKLSPELRRVALDRASAYRSPILAAGKPLCYRATYLRNRRWKGVKDTGASTKTFVLEASPQGREWVWYARHFLPKVDFAFRPSSTHDGARGRMVASEWPPVRMREAPEMLLPLATKCPPDKIEGRTRSSLAETVEDPWLRIQKRLSTEMGDAVFTSWFAALSFDRVEDAAVHILAPSRFAKSWIEQHYAERLRAVATAEFGGARTVVINVAVPMREPARQARASP